MRAMCLVFVLPISIGMTLFVAQTANSQPPGGGGPGGAGGPNAADVELVEEFDEDKDGRLNTEERSKARKSIQGNESSPRRGPRRRENRPPGTPGEQVSPADATSYPSSKALYDRSTLRTLFLDFESDDWEQELADFKYTDVEVPAKLTVDGKVYADIGVRFRGASSFFSIPKGLKRSLNLSINYADKDQRLYGYKTLNLLNCNGDDSMMSSVLYSAIAGHKVATPKVNFVKVVINGENWGVYVNSQQFNKVFINENFGTTKGARWKVPGSPRGDGGLRYLGEDIEPYRERFEIKSKDREKSWQDLIHLCRVLNETPADQIEEALEPILDIEGVLWFLAVDVALVNSDGYWTRASDYNIYQAPDGRFHVIPHDMNEALREGHGGPGGPGGRPGFGPLPEGGPPGFGPPPEGGPPPGFDGRPGAPSQDAPRAGRRRRGDEGRPEPGGNRGDIDRRRGPGQRGGPGRRGPGGPGRGGVELDPLVGLDDDSKPLRSKLLANPRLRARYLQHVRTIADQMLSWDYLGPRVAEMRELIAEEVAADTRKLGTTESFLNATSPEAGEDGAGLRGFAEKRSAYLLDHEAIKALPSRQND
ncbi:CotH kinase family protein [Adhaeretor mobilis]|uniref:CotH protein n=1 Tax=Adhaeretor mobilis TaxID=1930276 RepID=A0A517MRQ5_9BACT|nr:CotH kinase family protein [Adhaeretor mobilis]QDS97560.1 CotH protein [Adhaeretor mobilis]